MKKINQKGFSVVEGLLITGIVAILGFIGWYVYQQSQKQDETSQPQSSTVALNSPTTEDESKEQPPKEVPKLVKSVKYANVPEGLKAAIIAEYKENAPACLDGDTYISKVDKDLLVGSIYDGKFARAGIGCDGGASGLFALHNGEWTHIYSTQDVIPCDGIVTYKVPAAYVEQCLQDDELIDNPSGY